MIFIVFGCLLSRLLPVVWGSGQSCQDLDPQACSDMDKQNPNMCMDHDLATAVCPNHCHRCPITCYNCNTTTTDVRGCNTFTCNINEVCMVSKIHQLMAAEKFYNLRCASESACHNKQSGDALSDDTKCCSDDLCNSPDLIPHMTSSSSSLTNFQTTTLTLSTVLQSQAQWNTWGSWQCIENAVFCFMQRFRECSTGNNNICGTDTKHRELIPCNISICPAHWTEWGNWQSNTTGELCVQLRYRQCSTGNVSHCGEERNTWEIKLCDSLSSTKPNIFGVCNFDSGTICTWTQSNQDSFDWSLQSGPTLTDGTGPNNDHTLQTSQGKYLFIESSSPRLASENATIVSPELPSDHTLCLEFWYYMFGDGIGSLLVHAEDTYSKNVIQLLKKDGNQGESWFKASVTIYSKHIAHNYRLVITANVGSYKGDTAIDDLALHDGACEVSSVTPHGNGYSSLQTSTGLPSTTSILTGQGLPSTTGQWSEWFSGKCTVTCGYGTQHRLRFCSTGQNGDCLGSPSDSVSCHEQICQTQGIWSEWFYATCSSTCENGTTWRIRQCSTGLECPGNEIETIPCKLTECQGLP